MTEHGVGTATFNVGARGRAIGVAVDIMDMAADCREKLFPDLRKIIVDHEVEIAGGRLTLNVTSAPISALG